MGNDGGGYMFSINWFMAEEQLQKYDGIWSGEVSWDTVNFYKDYVGTLSNNENLAGHLQKQIKIQNLLLHHLLVVYPVLIILWISQKICI